MRRSQKFTMATMWSGEVKVKIINLKTTSPFCSLNYVYFPFRLISLLLSYIMPTVHILASEFILNQIPHF